MKQCGIYVIENKINGKRYYGSTSNWTKRKNEHLNKLRKRKHANSHLQAAWNKYGESAFIFNFILNVYEHFLLFVEQIYIDNNKSGYNIALYTSAPMRGRKLSGDAREKISTALKTDEMYEKLAYWKDKTLSKEHKNNVSISLKGKLKSQTHKDNISKGRKDIEFSKEHLNNLSVAHLKPETKGYYWYSNIQKFRVRISRGGKRYSGGYFKTESEATVAVEQLLNKIAGNTK